MRGNGGLDALRPVCVDAERPITVNFTAALDIGTGDLTITADSLNVNAAVSTRGGGNVSLTSTNGVTLSGANADITTSGGAVTIDADSNDDGTRTYTQDDAGSAVTTSNGAVLITAASVDLTGTIFSVNGAIGNIVGNAGSGTIDITTVLNTTLADNGGFTLTHALAADSLAVNV